MVETKTIYLLEDCDSPYNYRGKKTISLDPGVSFSLYQNNITYNIPEDYYHQKELIDVEKKYFSEQLEWFDLFDNFLKEQISYCKQHNIPLCKANYLRLKYFIDTVVIYSYILFSIFKKHREIEEVIYTHRPYIEDYRYSIFKFKSKNRKVFCNLLELFCKESNIKFTDHVINSESYNLSRVSRQKELFNILAKNSFIKRHAKKAVNIIKYGKFKKFFSTDSFFKNLNVFFMQAGSFAIDYPIRELVGQKAHVYIKENKAIIKEDSLFRQSLHIPSVEDSLLEKLEWECKEAAEKFETTPLLDWVNSKCLIDVASAVLPFLKYFIADDCFYILKDTETMRRFYKQNKIGYIFARGNTDIESMGSLIAARYCGGAKSICCQHASLTRDLEAVGVMDTETYDYTLTADGISQEYYENFLRNNYKTNCRIFQSPHYFENIKKVYSKRKVLKKRKEKVLYITQKFSDRVKCFNNINYPLTWYFEFQKKVMDFFNQENNFDFIYKHVPAQSWAEYSIFSYIKKKGYMNIYIYSKEFLKSLDFAQRIIVDAPTTNAIFEAAAARKSILIVYPDCFSMLDSAKRIFGKSLQPFSSAEEAISRMKEFLYSDPDDYLVNLPLSGEDFIDVFKRIIIKEKDGQAAHL